jgi:hypothetical protein
MEDSKYQYDARYKFKVGETPRCRVCNQDLLVGENWCMSHSVNFNYICNECNRIKNLSYVKSKESHARSIEYGRKYRENPEKTESRKQATKRWRESHKEYIKDKALQKNYGITLKEFHLLLSHQNNKCAICEVEFTENMPYKHVDHEHSSGIVRGILCVACNQGIGSFKDNPIVIRLSIDYLKKHSGE